MPMVNRNSRVYKDRRILTIGHAREIRKRDRIRLRLFKMFMWALLIFTLFSIRMAFLALHKTNSQQDFSTYFHQKITPQINATIAIGGLFRNNGKDNTLRMYRLMKDTASYFEKHYLIFLENDSTDGTAQVLRRICNADPNTICITMKLDDKIPQFLPHFNESDHGSPFSQHRFSRMSWLRNIVLDQAKSLPDIQYFAFCDPDLFGAAWLPLHHNIWPRYIERGLGSWPGWWGGNAQGWKASSVYEAVQRANSQLSSWSSVCFYGAFSTRFHQYDMLAFRLSDKTPIPDTARRYQSDWTAAEWNFHFSAESLEAYQAEAIDLHMGMIAFNYASSQKHIPVKSCFGGMSVYKIDRLRACQYDETTRDCEHVSLNECLFKEHPDSIYVDPKSRVYYDFYAVDYDTR